MSPVFLQKVQALFQEFPNESLAIIGVFGALMFLMWWSRGFADYRRFRFHELRMRRAREQAKNVAAKLSEVDKKHAELMRLISTSAQPDQLNTAATEASVLFLDLRRANAALQAALNNSEEWKPFSGA